MLMLVVVIVVNLISFGLYFSALSDATPVISSTHSGQLFLRVFSPPGAFDPGVPDEEKAVMGLTVVKPTS